MIRADRVIPAVLAEVIRKAPLCPEKVDFAWQSAVGPVVSRATRVALSEDGVLRVTAETPQWAYEIRRSSRVILRRLEPLLGEGTVRRLETTGARG